MHPKSCRRFQIDRSCRLGSSCAYFYPDHSREGNKKTNNDVRVELESPEKATKEGIHQLKATIQHLSAKILTLNLPFHEEIQLLK